MIPLSTHGTHSVEGGCHRLSSQNTSTPYQTTGGLEVKSNPKVHFLPHHTPFLLCPTPHLSHITLSTLVWPLLPYYFWLFTTVHITSALITLLHYTQMICLWFIDVQCKWPSYFWWRLLRGVRFSHCNHHMLDICLLNLTWLHALTDYIYLITHWLHVYMNSIAYTHLKRGATLFSQHFHKCYTKIPHTSHKGRLPYLLPLSYYVLFSLVV